MENPTSYRIKYGKPTIFTPKDIALVKHVKSELSCRCRTCRRRIVSAETFSMNFHGQIVGEVLLKLTQDIEISCPLCGLHCTNCPCPVEILAEKYGLQRILGVEPTVIKEAGIKIKKNPHIKRVKKNNVIRRVFHL